MSYIYIYIHAHTHSRADLTVYFSRARASEGGTPPRNPPAPFARPQSRGDLLASRSLTTSPRTFQLASRATRTHLASSRGSGGDGGCGGGEPSLTSWKSVMTSFLTSTQTRRDREKRGEAHVQRRNVTKLVYSSTLLNMGWIRVNSTL